ncbi:MAG: septum site-determining protein MinD [Eubacteriales bacterium]|nr:septum site-determining protein MinD [Eubacteriales bacterium]
MGRVIMVASGKGGTGKSMVSANLGALFAMVGQRVVIVDMDMGLRNVDLYLGLEEKVLYDAHDVMMGISTISQALVQDERIPNLWFLGASVSREDGSLTPLHAEILCEKLKSRFDLVILDAPAGTGDGLVIASAGAEMAVMVSTPEYASLRDVGALDKILAEMGILKRGLLLNRVVPDLMKDGIVPSLQEIAGTIDSPLLGVILEDRNILLSTNLGIPIVLKEDTYIFRNFLKIAARIINMLGPENESGNEESKNQKQGF